MNFLIILSTLVSGVGRMGIARIFTTKSFKKPGYFLSNCISEPCTLFVSMAKKSCSNRSVTKFTLILETSGTDGPLLHATMQILDTSINKIFLIFIFTKIVRHKVQGTRFKPRLKAQGPRKKQDQGTKTKVL